MSSKNPRALNLGCGVSYHESSEWINADWQSNSKAVERHNLLKRLPWNQESFELVYSSHLIEHLTLKDAHALLLDCFRLLIPGGTLRLSLPDFEEMARSYVRFKNEGEELKSQFVLTEILDQCVRLTPSGTFPKWYQMTATDRDLEEFVLLRTGINMRNRAESLKHDLSIRKKSLFEKFGALARRGRNLIVRKYISAVILLLPRWFRSYHVSRATPGERHMWLYDFASLSNLLSEIGFVEISKVDEPATRSSVKDVLSLDFNNLGRPIKGISTMFVEASKPL